MGLLNFHLPFSLEAYAQNQTPVAYRAFWYYGPDKNEIAVIAITPHP